MNAYPSLPSGKRQTARLYWWTRPSRLALLVHLPIFLLCAALDEQTFVFYRQSAKFLAGSAVVSGALAIVAFGFFAAWFEPSRGYRSPERISAARIDNVINALFAIVLLSYSIFLFPIFLAPGLMLELLSGSPSVMYELRETLNRIPGVTSFMTLQSILVVLIASYTALTGQRAPTKYRTLLIVVAVACVMRALLWSERLAVIELTLPAFIVLLARMTPDQERSWFRPLSLAPLFGLLALTLVFAVGEYFRSWQHYKYIFSGSYAEFIWLRFVGYYATALNNGAALYQMLDPFHVPVWTAEWFYKLPIWQIVPGHLSPVFFRTTDFLDIYLNREFNNMSGVFLPIMDYGPILGIACWAVLGAISGMLFQAFARGEFSGLVFYPVWYTGIVEILRIFYWGDARFFPVILGAAIVVWYATRRTRAASPDLAMAGAGE